MKRSRIVSVTACLLATAALAAVSHLPKANTRAEVKRYVEDAAKVVKANGASCKTFESPEWRNGEYYIFVSGPDGKLLCHPQASLVGKDEATVVNLKGEKVGEMILLASRGNSKGWVEYAWTRPGKSHEEPKSTYAMGVTGPDGKHYSVGGGGWNLKK
jgi:signal transduction histidine kinase